MKTLVISKPEYNYILPLVEFPSDGDRFYIEKAINTISGNGSLIALTLGKYGVDIDFAGVVGEDDIAKKIREIFNKHQVKLKYLETSYTDRTLTSFKIYNSKTNKFTSINETASKAYLTKYKYEFIPEVIIMDDKDYNANIAAINNFPDATLIYLADKFNKTSNIYLNKCKYVISDLAFASNATGVNSGLEKSSNLVGLFQKFIDIYNTNLIVKLDNFDLLYIVDDEVRLIKNINKNITNKEPIYYGVLIYFLINQYSIEESIKLANKVMLESNNDIDFINDIPDFKILEKTIKEYEEYKKNNNELNIQSGIEENNIQDNFKINNTQNTNTIINSSNINNELEEQINPVELHNPNLSMHTMNDNIERLDLTNLNNESLKHNNINTTNGVNNG